jgi:hypothetical protein
MVPFTVAGGAVSSKSDRRLFAVLPLGVFSFKRYSRDCYLKKEREMMLKEKCIFFLIKEGVLLYFT